MKTNKFLTGAYFAAWVCLIVAWPSAAQFSDANWIGLGGLPGANGPIRAATADSNGNIYAAGDFTVIGNVSAPGVAKWNGKGWSALGAAGDLPHSGSPRTLALDNSGNLYAGGEFVVGSNVAGILKWDGTSWTSFSPPGITNVSALICDNGGSLYAGGSFKINDGYNLAKWDGNTWATVGPAASWTTYSSANCLAFDSTGSLYVGGGSYGVNKWDGSKWTTWVLTGKNAAVYSLSFDNSGNLYAGGYFSGVDGSAATNVAELTGSGWSAVGTGITTGLLTGAVVRTVACNSANQLFVGGIFSSAGGVTVSNIAMWDGAAWSPVGSGVSAAVNSLMFNSTGKLFVGGEFTIAGTFPADYIAQWSSNAWSTLGSGINNSVWSAAVDKAGHLYVGGSFTSAGIVSANAIAEWDGSAWSALGSGMTGGHSLGSGDNIVSALACDPAGNVYAGGIFSMAGGVAASNIAKWDGTNWSALGTGIKGLLDQSFAPAGCFVYALACDSNGNLYAGGSFSSAGEAPANCVAKWDGSVWSALGSGTGVGGYSPVHALACDSSGNLYAGGSFSTAGGSPASLVAKWNGSTWTALGAGVGTPGDDVVSSLAIDIAGNVYVGGIFSTAGGIAANNVAKWNGSAWSALGSGLALSAALSTYPGTPWTSPHLGGCASLVCDGAGNVYAGGFFTNAGGLQAHSIARWDGVNWSALGSGMNSNVAALVFDPSGNLDAGGGFTTTGTNAAGYMAKLLLTRSSSNWALSPNGGGTNVISASGTPGYSYVLDFATNLTQPMEWTAQATNKTQSVNMSFTNAAPGPQGFYRLRCLP